MAVDCVFGDAFQSCYKYGNASGFLGSITFHDVFVVILILRHYSTIIVLASDFVSCNDSKIIFDSQRRQNVCCIYCEPSVSLCVSLFF